MERDDTDRAEPWWLLGFAAAATAATASVDVSRWCRGGSERPLGGALTFVVCLCCCWRCWCLLRGRLGGNSRNLIVVMVEQEDGGRDPVGGGATHKPPRCIHFIGASGDSETAFHDNSHVRSGFLLAKRLVPHKYGRCSPPWCGDLDEKRAGPRSVNLAGLGERAALGIGFQLLCR